MTPVRMETGPYKYLPLTLSIVVSYTQTLNEICYTLARSCYSQSHFGNATADDKKKHVAPAFLPFSTPSDPRAGSLA